MLATSAKIGHLLDSLEQHYGKLKPQVPDGAYEMLLFANCGYPANDATCTKGFEALKKNLGIRPDQILAAPDKDISRNLRLGGIFPELRAQRLKEIATRVKNLYSGKLDSALRKTPSDARKILKQFPTIADPGADKILLFTEIEPVAAVPSNCVHVPLRLGLGTAHKTYTQDYRSAQDAIAAALPENCSARRRAYLLLQRHGQELCKRSRPKCDLCPLTLDCRYYQVTH